MNQRKGLSMIELLIVVAIVMVLLSMLLPAIQGSREAARKTTCANQLRQVGLAMHHHDNMLGFLPFNANNWSAISRACIYTDYFAQLNLDHNTDPLVDFSWRVPVVRAVNCPNETLTVDGSSSYVTCSGSVADYLFVIGGIGDSTVAAATGTADTNGVPPTVPYEMTRNGICPDQQADGVVAYYLSLAEVAKADGTSHTIMLGESRYRFIAPAPFGSATAAYVPRANPSLGFDSLHPISANYVKADGSVQTIRHDIEIVLLQALATWAGSEPLDLD